jgi:hypothetical protein
MTGDREGASAPISEDEQERRRDDALRRALAMPPRKREAAAHSYKIVGDLDEWAIGVGDVRSSGKVG